LWHSAADVGGALNTTKMKKRDQADRLIGDILFEFTHIWVDGFGWENTIMLPSDFDRVSKMPIKAKDGKQLFMAYTYDEGNDDMKATKFKGLIHEVTDPILQFFTYPRMELLNISAIETAAGMPSRTLYKFVKGTRGLPKKHRAPLIEILKKVGYDG